MKLKKILVTVGALLIAFAPVMASAATDTKSTTINATVAPVISMTTSSTVAISITPTPAGSASSQSDTVTVNSNNSSGYDLTLANTDTTLTLVNGGNSIAQHTGTYGSPTTLANNAWGYRVDSLGTFGVGPTSAQTNQANLAGIWAGVPSSASPQNIRTTSAVATNDVTTVWYGVKADSTKPNGVYTDSVTYTATTKP